jgi:hypothetical protein
MNPTIKAKWVAALRGGQYKQTAGRLRHLDAYCCLGVLCELYRGDTATDWDMTIPGDFRYLGDAYVLPPEVSDWAGLGERCPKIVDRTLGDWNDGTDGCGAAVTPKTFPEIADLIEKHL